MLAVPYLLFLLTCWLEVLVDAPAGLLPGLADAFTHNCLHAGFLKLPGAVYAPLGCLSDLRAGMACRLWWHIRQLASAAGGYCGRDAVLSNIFRVQRLKIQCGLQMSSLSCHSAHKRKAGTA